MATPRWRREPKRRSLAVPTLRHSASIDRRRGYERFDLRGERPLCFAQGNRAFLDELGAEPDARLVVSPFILAEAYYLISERDNSPDIALRVLRDVAAGGYHLEPFGPEDLDRAADVIERYGDQDIGLADASNVVLAERHGTSSILTLDERHFRALRGPGGEPFHLLPTDC